MKISKYFSGYRDPEIVPLDFWLERFRNWRMNELISTDWTQLPDAPVDKAAWATYRQALRDLPLVTDFANAELPTQPGAN
jgi:hypothetical protein